MNFVGRITKDAVVTQLKDERKVVNFSVALNDYYKPKGQEQGVKVTTFVNCSYWISTTIAERLTKGALVEIAGRIYVNAYMSTGNEAKASLNCHVNSIKIHQSTKQETMNESQDGKQSRSSKKKEVTDDLPF